jgi:hypothetical protein
MRWDASTLLDGKKKLTEWVNGGKCPFEDSERMFYFQEDKRLWKPGKPTMLLSELMKALFKNANIKF